MSATQPGRLSFTVEQEEKLRHAAINRGVANLGPEQAAALLTRLAALEAITQRAHEAMESDIWISGTDAARWILTGEEPGEEE